MISAQADYVVAKSEARSQAAESSPVNGSVFAIKRDYASVILPEHYLVLNEMSTNVDPAKSELDPIVPSDWRKIVDDVPSASQGFEKILKSMEVNSSNLSPDLEEKLTLIEESAQREFRAFEDRISADLDPEESEKIEAEEREAKRLQDVLRKLRAQIDDEKAKQERVLHDLRNGANGYPNRR